MKKVNIIIISIIIVIILILLVSLLFIFNDKKEYNKISGNLENNAEDTQEDELSLYSSKSPVVPEGFKKIETETASWEENEDGEVVGWNNGLVIEDEIGNQFVWIPVEKMQDFKKMEGYFARDSQKYIKNCSEADSINTTIESVELYNSVKKYKGFYIARYEAGIEDISKKHIQNGSIKPVSKANTTVWNEIVWGSAYGYALDGVQGSDTEYGAVKVARSMYPNVKYLSNYKLPKDLENNTGVISTLCYGVQWDATMKFLSDVNNPFTNTRYIVDSTNMGWYALNSGSKIQLTGVGVDSSNSNCVKNIYDLAGNVYEWTMESYKNNYRVYRGGMYEMANASPSASLRSHGVPDIYGGMKIIGFRVTLYIK